MQKFISLLILICLISLKTSSATPLLIDSSAIINRTFDAKKIKQLKKEKHYDYGIDEVKKPSNNQLIRFFIQFIEQLIRILFSNWKELSTVNLLIRIGIYLAFFSLIIYVLFQIINIKSVFSRKNKTIKIDYDIEQENIHELDFNQLIQNAIKEKQYRLAIRLNYLFTLKKLSDKQYIQWSIEKTNMHYIIELKPAYQHQFIALSNVFDWIWYGEHELDEDDYISIEKQFSNFNKSIL